MQAYSDPKRASDPHALPDVEIFQMSYAWCGSCDGLMQDEDAKGYVHCQECGHENRPVATGFFWWACSPGCLPDNAEPIGPFQTEAEALADAQADSD